MSSVDVIVNCLVDAAPNATECFESQSANNACSLRSAFSYCVLRQSSTSHCRIILPSMGILQMKSSLGYVDVILSQSVSVTLEGAGATVTLDMASRAPLAAKSGLARIEGLDGTNSTFSMSDVSFSYFSDSVFYIQNIGISVSDSHFLNNKANNGKLNYFLISY